MNYDNKATFLGIVLLTLMIGCDANKTNNADHNDVQITELKTFGNYVNDEELLLGMPVRLKYDNNSQHLFIQDLPKWGITEIDESSKVINQYGQRGRGPGEIQMLNDFFYNEDHLFIVDGGRFFIHKYSRNDGKHISSLDYGKLRTKRTTFPADGAPPPSTNATQ